MTDTPRLWILNLDGEHELEGGARYQPTARLQGIVERTRAALWQGAGALVRPGDLVLADPATAPHLARGSEPVACLRVEAEGARPLAVERSRLRGLTAEAWLATERARAVAQALGVRLGEHGDDEFSGMDGLAGCGATGVTNAPDELDTLGSGRGSAGSHATKAMGERATWLATSMPATPAITGNPPPPTSAPHQVIQRLAPPNEVSRESGIFSPLHAVNARDFAAALHAQLVPQAPLTKHIARTLDAALAIASRPAPRGWLARRRFGAAGRGRRKLHAGDQPAPASAWLEASLRTGPLVLEPLVRIEHEYTRSGTVTPQGHVHMSEPCFQATTAEGAWTHTERRGHEVAPADDAALAQAFEAAGHALAAAGYSGPFGIDAFRYRDPWNEAHSHLNPLSEINARYTMDWALALSPRRTT